MGMLAITFVGLVLLAAAIALFSVCLATSAPHPKVREDLSLLGQILKRLTSQLVSAGVLAGGLGAMIALVGCGLVLLNRTLQRAPESTRPPALAAGGPVRNIPAIGRLAPECEPDCQMIAGTPVPIVDPYTGAPPADGSDRALYHTSHEVDSSSSH